MAERRTQVKVKAEAAAAPDYDADSDDSKEVEIVYETVTEDISIVKNDEVKAEPPDETETKTEEIEVILLKEDICDSEIKDERVEFPCKSNEDLTQQQEGGAAAWNNISKAATAPKPKVGGAANRNSAPLKTAQKANAQAPGPIYSYTLGNSNPKESQVTRRSSQRRKSTPKKHLLVVAQPDGAGAPAQVPLQISEPFRVQPQPQPWVMGFSEIKDGVLSVEMKPDYTALIKMPPDIVWPTSLIAVCQKGAHNRTGKIMLVKGEESDRVTSMGPNCVSVIYIPSDHPVLAQCNGLQINASLPLPPVKNSPSSDSVISKLKKTNSVGSKQKADPAEVGPKTSPTASGPDGVSKPAGKKSEKGMEYVLLSDGRIMIGPEIVNAMSTNNVLLGPQGVVIKPSVNNVSAMNSRSAAEKGMPIIQHIASLSVPASKAGSVPVVKHVSTNNTAVTVPTVKTPGNKVEAGKPRSAITSLVQQSPAETAAVSKGAGTKGDSVANMSVIKLPLSPIMKAAKKPEEKSSSGKSQEMVLKVRQVPEINGLDKPVRHLAKSPVQGTPRRQKAKPVRNLAVAAEANTQEAPPAAAADPLRLREQVANARASAGVQSSPRGVKRLAEEVCDLTTPPGSPSRKKISAGIITPDKTDDISKIGHFFCSECDWYRTKSPQELVIHLEWHLTGMLVHCDACDFKATQMSSLREHIKQQHPVRRIVKPCEICGHLATTQDQADHHTKLHATAGKKKFKCGLCDYSFMIKEDCLRHRRTHTGDRLYMCEECGTATSRGIDHLKHMRNHLPTLLCDDCDFQTKSVSGIRRHVQQHLLAKARETTKKLAAMAQAKANADGGGTPNGKTMMLPRRNLKCPYCDFTTELRRGELTKHFKKAHCY